MKRTAIVASVLAMVFVYAQSSENAQATDDPAQIAIVPELLKTLASAENIPPELASLLLPEKAFKKNSQASLADVPLEALAQTPSLSVEWSGATQWLTGINWGGSNYFGSFDIGLNFFGSNITPDQYVKVELRFSSIPAEQTLCQTFARPGYAPVGVGTFPGSAWDMSDPANPRRLNIGFVEWTGGNPPPNLQWDPNGTGSPIFGNREYLFVFNSDYDGTGLTYNTTNIFNDNPDVLYAWWPLVPSGSSFFENEPATLTVTPHYITNLYAIPSPTELQINWNLALDTADHYLLYTGTSSPANTLLDSIDGNITSFTHTSLATGVPRFYRVEAYGAETVVVGCCVTAGDYDNSGAFNIADVTSGIARIFGSGPAPVCDAEADGNSDGSFNISDVTFGIARIFSGGPPPQCPGPMGTPAPLLTTSVEISATPQSVSLNVELLGAWNGRSNYGDCWGYIESGTNKEYALMCARNEGVSIIDIDVTPPVEVGFIPSISPGTDAKDVKIYQNFAIVIKESEPVQIVDISDVTNPVQVSTIQPNGGSGAHNCIVDGDFLYIVGNHSVGGLEVFDISTPSAPVRIGTGFEPFYYHDLDVRNDTMYAAGINGNGIDILDVSNKAAISRLGLFNYTGSGAHNAELLGATDYVAIGDEIGSSGNHLRIFDVADITNVTKVFDLDVNPAAVVHNCYEKDGFLYIAYYTEGLRIWDVADPTAPFEVGFYDSEPSGAVGFNGAWNVFPYFPSGKIIISDFSTGLYVVQRTP